MARWFRFYSEVVNDPKVQKLPCEDFRAWVNILCLASENDGKLPSIHDMAFALRLSDDAMRTVVERLSNGGLIDRLSGGPDGYHYAPHGWDKRQYKSDTSTDRVKRFRKRSTNVTETPPDTESDTEQNRKKEKATPSPKKALRRCPDGWMPSPEDLAAGEPLTPDQIQRELSKFRDHTFGTARSDWSATFRNWLRRASEDKRNVNSARSPKLDHLNGVASAMVAACERPEGEHRTDSLNAGSGGGMSLLR